MPQSDVVDLGTIITAADRAYGLLLWLGDLVDEERITVTEARRVLASREGATDFLQRHRASLPITLLPPNAEDERLTANILGTFLSVSFDLQDQASERRRPDPVCGPGCPWCWHVSQGPHLRVRTPTASDKRRAREAMRRAVEDLVESTGADHDSATVDALVADRPEEAAVIAYARSLSDRALGRSSSSTSLALWRLFAWNGGSPKRGFRFDLALVERSRAALHQDVEKIRIDRDTIPADLPGPVPVDLS